MSGATLLMSATRLGIPGGGVWQLGIGVAQFGQVGRARPRVELAQQGVVEWGGLGLVDLAAWIIEIAKNDGPGRAYRLACRGDVPVDQALTAVFGFDPRVGDALHAVRALFHHAAHAD